MIITCKCLNVSLDLGKIKPKGIPLASLKLSHVEEVHEFFSEGVAEMEKIIGITKQVAALTTSKTVGSWIIETCINCSQAYIAKHKDNMRQSLISAGLIADPNTMLMIKSRPEYSPVFSILIKEPTQKISSSFDLAFARNSLSELQQQFASAVKKEGEKTDEKIRIFTDQQHELLGNFRDRAVRDHEALSRILRQVEAQAEAADLEPALVPPPLSPAAVYNSLGMVDVSTPKSMPRSTSRPIIGIGKSQRGFGPVAASFDAEGVFDIEEMEPSPEPNASDVDSDTDHDDSSSHDEGIEIHRKKTNPLSVARSLPVNVPAFPAAAASYRMRPVEFHPEDLELEEEPAPAPSDIAASIKALARSVHQDVFGDLPRPRFSTQI